MRIFNYSFALHQYLKIILLRSLLLRLCRSNESNNIEVNNIILSMNNLCIHLTKNKYRHSVFKCYIQIILNTISTKFQVFIFLLYILINI